MSQYVNCMANNYKYECSRLHICDMSRMSGTLILSYRLKQVINSYVFQCFWIWRIVHISATRCLIEMGFESKCSILNGQVIYIEKSKLNIADMWLIPLDRVTYFIFTSTVEGAYMQGCVCVCVCVRGVYQNKVTTLAFYFSILPL